MQKIIFYALLLANLMITNAFAYEYIATIINVADGDTFTAFVHNENTKIRLIGVDCYETKMNKRAPIQKKLYNLPYTEIFKLGKQSKNKLKNLLQNHRYIHVKWNERDGYGRILGQVLIDDIKSAEIIDVNQYMLEHGGCNKFVKTSKSKKNKK